MKKSHSSAGIRIQKADPEQRKQQKSKIFLVDDHAILRQGIAQLINGRPDMTVVGEAEDIPSALNGIPRAKPDLCVLDLSLKDGDGVELIKTLRVQQPELLLLVLSMHPEALYAPAVIRAGAMGYVMKDQNILKLIDAIHQVLNRRIYLSPEIMHSIMCGHIAGRTKPLASPMDNFTDREQQVFRLIAQWRRPKEIARDLNLSVKTVDYYRNRLKDKLNLASVAQLTRYATEIYTTRVEN
jgi:DNA-binding NarL/FixJ family response regulator